MASVYLVQSEWEHPLHGRVSGSCTDLVNNYPEMRLSQGNLSNVALGKGGRLSEKGWSLYGKLA